MSWAWAAGVWAAPTGTILYHEPLQLESLSAATDGGPRSAELSVDYVEVLRFTAFGRTFELHVQPNDRLARRWSRSDIELLPGKVAGDPDSWVRLTRNGKFLRGLIRTGGDTYAVEPTDTVATAALNPGERSSSDNAVFRLADVLIPAGSATCGMNGDGQMLNAEAALDALAMEFRSPDILEAAGAVAQIEIGALGDFEFFGQFGSSSEAELMTRFNIVDGIFSDQLGVAVTVSDTMIFSTDAEDPFSNTTNASNLLDEVTDYRVANQLSLGLTHLLTGKNLDGATVGIAVRGETTATGQPLFGACTASGVGLSQTQSFLASTSALIIAHEIGHNFGALHDSEAADPGQDPNPCESTPPTFLMAPSLNGSATFSQCSLDTMQVIVDAANCLSPAPIDDVAMIAPADMTVGTGNQFDLVFAVANVGDGNATGVVAQFDVPATLTLSNLTAAQGSCNLLVQECVVGNIAEGASTTVTATLTADIEGPATVSATAIADTDDNPDNDNASVMVDVSSSVDLTASVAGAATLDVGTSGTAQISIANLSSLAASNVTVNFSSSAGLAISAAQSPQGSCTVTECALDTMDAMSSLQLTVDYDADAAGAQIISVTVTSDETDSAPSNNSGQLDITVNASPPASAATSGGGGGGSLGLGSLLMLLVGRKSRANNQTTNR